MRWQCCGASPASGHVMRSAVSAVLVKGGRGKSGVKKSKVPPRPAPAAGRADARAVRLQVSGIKIAAKNKNKGKKKK